MKKTLIALATLAAVSGTAFAQSTVTLSGAAIYGYQSTKTAGVTTKGLGVDTAAVTFAAVEDLGGGLKAAASMTVAGMNRSSDAANGENMTLTLSGGFGSIMAGAIEIGSGIRGLAQAGAPVNNLEGEILAAAADSDIVKYTSPAFNGFTLSASLTEGTTTNGLENGFGKGLSTGNAKATTVGVNYANGPLAAALDTSSWKDSTSDNRVRISANYNLGVATVGAGYDSTKLVAGTKTNYTMVGVSAPLGAVTVGAVMVKKDAANVKTDGYSVGAKYAFSKRTSLEASLSKFDGTTAAQDDKFKVLLAHAF
jgi:Gram-negative porin